MAVTKLQPVQLNANALYRDSASTVAKANQVIVQGWNYQVGNNLTSMALNLTLPITFDDANYTFIVTYQGAKGSVPTSVSDTGSNPNNCTAYVAGNVARTASTITIVIADVNSTNLSNAVYFLVDWIAIGTKA